jgi:hypothetical protein
MDAKFCFLKEISGMGANEDGAQKSIILTTSSKLTGSLLWVSSVKQSIVVQSRFCNTLAMVRMTHNGKREKKAIEGYMPIQKRKNKRSASFCLGITAFSFVG